MDYETTGDYEKTYRRPHSHFVFNLMGIILTAITTLIFLIVYIFFPEPGMYETADVKMGWAPALLIYILPFIVVIALILFDKRAIAIGMSLIGAWVIYETTEEVDAVFIIYIAFTVILTVLMLKSYSEHEDEKQMAREQIITRFGLRKTNGSGFYYWGSSTYNNVSGIEKLVSYTSGNMVLKYSKRELVTYTTTEVVGSEYEYETDGHGNKIGEGTKIRDITRDVEHQREEVHKKTESYSSATSLLSEAAAISLWCEDKTVYAYVTVSNIDFEILVGKFMYGNIVAL